MGDVDLMNQERKCEHDTAKGVTWKRVVKRKHWGIIPYTLIEKECQACGDTFLSTLDGKRILN